jgi:tetratricopeptide (TPR) repeat protein
LHEESLGIRRELGDRRGIAVSLNNLGLLANQQGDYAAAEVLHNESLAISQDIGDRPGIATTLSDLGSAAFGRGDFTAARAHLEQSLSLQRDLGDRRGIAIALKDLAPVVAAPGDPRLAALLWGAAERLREEIGSPLPPTERPDYEKHVASARAALADAAAFDAAWQQGRAMTPDQAIECALKES